MRPLLRRPRFEEKRRKKKKKKSNFNSLTLPPKELEAQEMRPLLRRPRFEEKNKKENKIQHHFLDSAAKKKTQRKRCACSSAGGASKGIVEKASGSRTPLFFRGGGCRMIEYVE